MSVYKGTDALIYISGSDEADFKAVAVASSHTINESIAPIETANKSYGAYKSSTGGRKTVTGTIEGVADDADSTKNYKEIWKLVESRETVKMIFANRTSDADMSADTSVFYCTGSFFFTDFSITSPDGEKVNWNAGFTLAEKGDFHLINVEI